jgi:L-malate glycosyltransferase
VPLHVLHLIGSFERGGSEAQAVQLASLLHQEGSCRVSIACFDGSGPLRASLDRLGLPIAQFPLSSFHDRNAALQWRRFANLLHLERVQIVQTHDFYTNVFGMPGALLARVPLRIAARRDTSGLRSPMQLRVERLAYRCAHRIVANSRAVADQLARERVDPARIVTIHNGLDLSRFPLLPQTPQALARFALPAGRPLIVIVANMRHPVKDQATFLHAAAAVHRDFPEAAFVLAGEGELMPALRDLAKQLAIGSDTFFLGPCQDVPALLACAAVCVLSSRAEGFANAILEYMAAARPVVATAVGGAAEAVLEGKTGHLVPPGDPASMAARISALLASPDLAFRMGAAGRCRVERHFSTAAQLAATLKLYGSLRPLA